MGPWIDSLPALRFSHGPVQVGSSRSGSIWRLVWFWRFVLSSSFFGAARVTVCRCTIDFAGRCCHTGRKNGIHHSEWIGFFCLAGGRKSHQHTSHHQNPKWLHLLQHPSSIAKSLLYCFVGVHTQRWCSAPNNLGHTGSPCIRDLNLSKKEGEPHNPHVTTARNHWDGCPSWWMIQSKSAKQDT